MLRARNFPAFFNSFTQGYRKRARPSPAEGDKLFGKLLTDVKNRAGAEGARWKGVVSTSGFRHSTRVTTTGTQAEDLTKSSFFPEMEEFLFP